MQGVQRDRKASGVMFLGLYILAIVAIILTIAGLRQLFAIRARFRGATMTRKQRRKAEAMRADLSEAIEGPRLKILQGGRR